MRKTWQAYGGDVAIWALAAIAVAGVVVGSAVTRIVVTVILAICAPLLATLRRRDVLALRRETELSFERAVAKEQARAEALAAVQNDLTGELNGTIVEIVAAQQAVVRAAHPDDVLLRLTAAEDSAHSSLQGLSAITAGLGTAGQAATAEDEPDQPTFATTDGEVAG
ncbi:MAG TPA: hypothetical protein VGJ28_17235 [Micromonosporaceae bacterium]|jgi:hypothetical protein